MPEPLAKYTQPIGFSADGKEFIFHDRKEGRIAVDLSAKTQRTIPTPIAQQNRWSAGSFRHALQQTVDFTQDGKAVAYVHEDGTEWRLVATDVEGREPDRVIARVTKPAKIELPLWAPDRTKIAYVASSSDMKAPRRQLHIAAADGSWTRKVETGEMSIGGWPANVSWSNDSTKLALTLNERAVSQLSVLENFLPTEKLVAK